MFDESDWFGGHYGAGGIVCGCRGDGFGSIEEVDDAYHWEGQYDSGTEFICG